MKCPQCGKENKETDKFCIKCGAELNFISWKADWKWHIKVLVVIYIILGLGYFMLKIFLK